MPLWTELFSGHDKSVPFKPKATTTQVTTDDVTATDDVMKTPPTVRRKRPPSSRSQNDTIAQIEQTMSANRQKKSSSPKTPQTPGPPQINIAPVVSGGDRVRLDPLSSDNEQESFSASWDLDQIMATSLAQFSECLQQLEPRRVRLEVSDQLLGSDTGNLLPASEADSVTSEIQDLPRDEEEDKENTGLNSSNQNPWILVKVPSLLYNRALGQKF